MGNVKEIFLLCDNFYEQFFSFIKCKSRYKIFDEIDR